MSGNKKNKRSKEKRTNMNTEFSHEIGINLPDDNDYSNNPQARIKSNTKKYQNQKPNQNEQ